MSRYTAAAACLRKDALTAVEQVAAAVASRAAGDVLLQTRSRRAPSAALAGHATAAARLRRGAPAPLPRGAAAVAPPAARGVLIPARLPDAWPGLRGSTAIAPISPRLPPGAPGTVPCRSR